MRPRLIPGHRGRWVPRRLRLFAVLAVAASLLLAGCSTGNDAAVYGGSFTFVSPGGKVEFSYPAGDRGTVGNFSGPKVGCDPTSTAKQCTTGTVSLSDFAGKVVVINFWGSWCPPCRAEAPGLNAAAQSLSGQGVQFLGADLKEASSWDAADFQTSKGIGYPSIYDPTMRTILSLRGYPVGSIPSTIVLDRQHRVAHIWLEDVTEKQLTDVVSAIAAEN